MDGFNDSDEDDYRPLMDPSSIHSDLADFSNSNSQFSDMNQTSFFGEPEEMEGRSGHFDQERHEDPEHEMPLRQPILGTVEHPRVDVLRRNSVGGEGRERSTTRRGRGGRCGRSVAESMGPPTSSASTVPKPTNCRGNRKRKRSFASEEEKKRFLRVQNTIAASCSRERKKQEFDRRGQEINDLHQQLVTADHQARGQSETILTLTRDNERSNKAIEALTKNNETLVIANASLVKKLESQRNSVGLDDLTRNFQSIERQNREKDRQIQGLQETIDNLQNSIREQAQELAQKDQEINRLNSTLVQAETDQRTLYPNLVSPSVERGKRSLERGYESEGSLGIGYHGTQDPRSSEACSRGQRPDFGFQAPSGKVSNGQRPSIAVSQGQRSTGAVPQSQKSTNPGCEGHRTLDSALEVLDCGYQTAIAIGCPPNLESILKALKQHSHHTNPNISSFSMLGQNQPKSLAQPGNQKVTEEDLDDIALLIQMDLDRLAASDPNNVAGFQGAVANESGHQNINLLDYLIMDDPSFALDFE